MNGTVHLKSSGAGQKKGFEGENNTIFAVNIILLANKSLKIFKRVVFGFVYGTINKNNFGHQDFV